MVAVIKTSHSIQRILNYNEFKTKEGKAECINAVNFPLDLDKLSFNLKLNRFLKQASLNENAKRNAVHISLNFDPSEKHSKEKLNQIANVYMDKIGFGKQPYLVYQHFDAGHPHIHIVTNNIQRDGKRIDLHLLGIKKSEPARKEIETAFDLIKADGRKIKEQFSFLTIPNRKIEYGKTESKKAITAVLSKVLSEYRYSSLSELNAVLNLYNVHADRGCEGSRVFKNNGLVYKIIDKDRKAIGIPIKASDFYFKPTLKYLENKITENKIRYTSYKTRLKNIISLSLANEDKQNISSFEKKLEAQGVFVVFRKSDSGLIYGITYVDFTTKNVFNGSSLGKEYSAKAIQEKLLQTTKNQADNRITHLDNKTTNINGLINLCNDLLTSEYSNIHLPSELKKKRKARKKRRTI